MSPKNRGLTPPNKRWSKEEVDKMRRRVINRLASVEEIAEEQGVSPQRIYYLIGNISDLAEPTETAMLMQLQADLLGPSKQVWKARQSLIEALAELVQRDSFNGVELNLMVVAGRRATVIRKETKP